MIIIIKHDKFVVLCIICILVLYTCAVVLCYLLLW